MYLAGKRPSVATASLAALLSLTLPGVAARADEGADSEISGWFRIDTDALGTQLWLGATHPVGGIDVASNVYLAGAYGELDVGPTFAFGPISLTPMVGIGFQLDAQTVSTLVAPQLFSIVSTRYLYFESWIQCFWSSPFADDAIDTAYTRDFLLYQISPLLHAGVQVEATFEIGGAENDNDVHLASLPVGGRINLGYGKNNTLGIFLGYETQAPEESDGVAGRFTFIRTW